MPILCFHAVDPDWESPLSVPPPAFEEMCQWLQRTGRVVPLRQVLPGLGRRGRPHGRKIALTFDDGFECFADHAVDILERYRLPATVFVVSRAMTGAQPVDWVRDPPAHSLRSLDASAIQELDRRELIDVESHSATHRFLTELSPDEALDDLTEARGMLGQVLGREVDLLAYPRGHHDQALRASSVRAGYRHAFSLPQGREHTGAMAVPRVGIFGGNSLNVARVKSTAGYLPVRLMRPAR